MPILYAENVFEGDYTNDLESYLLQPGHDSDISHASIR